MIRAHSVRFEPSPAFMEVLRYGVSKIHMPHAYRRKELHTTTLRLLRELPAEISAIHDALEAERGEEEASREEETCG